MIYPRFVLACICACLMVDAAQAQTTQDSVKAAVGVLFDGMRASDPVLIRSAFTHSAILQSIGEDKTGHTTVTNEQIDVFARTIGGMNKGDADERISIDVVRVDGSLAIVWAPYQFFYKGKFNHCGVDSFQLIRTAAGWKILYIVDTRRKTPCQ